MYIYFQNLLIVKIFYLIKDSVFTKKHDNLKKIITIIFFTLILIAFNTLITKWYGWFWEAIKDKNTNNIYKYFLMFLFIAIISILIKTELVVLKNKLFLFARKIMYENYNASVLNENICDTPCQRMSHDLKQLITTYINLMLSLLSSIITLPIFFVILMQSIHWTAALFCISYAVVGTIITQIIAKPIIKLDYENESTEGELRKELVLEVRKLNQNDKILPSMEKVIYNTIALLNKEKILWYFQNIYGQTGVIFPIFILLPYYLSDNINFGVFYSSVRIFSIVMDDVSFLVNQRDNIILLQATYNRVSELKITD